jgi:hypothetical protein
LRLEDVQRDVVAIFRSRGLTVIDGLPALQAEAARLGEPPYQPRDTHLDDRGHRALAEAVLETLTDR